MRVLDVGAIDGTDSCLLALCRMRLTDQKCSWERGSKAFTKPQPAGLVSFFSLSYLHSQVDSRLHSGEKKKTKEYKQLFGLSGNGWGSILFMCCLFSWRNRETKKNPRKYPGKCRDSPGIIPWKFCLCVRWIQEGLRGASVEAPKPPFGALFWAIRFGFWGSARLYLRLLVRNSDFRPVTLTFGPESESCHWNFAPESFLGVLQ